MFKFQIGVNTVFGVFFSLLQIFFSSGNEISRSYLQVEASFYQKLDGGKSKLTSADCFLFEQFRNRHLVPFGNTLLILYLLLLCSFYVPFLPLGIFILLFWVKLITKLNLTAFGTYELITIQYLLSLFRGFLPRIPNFWIYIKLRDLRPWKPKKYDIPFYNVHFVSLLLSYFNFHLRSNELRNRDQRLWKPMKWYVLSLPLCSFCVLSSFPRYLNFYIKIKLRSKLNSGAFKTYWTILINIVIWHAPSPVTILNLASKLISKMKLVILNPLVSHRIPRFDSC